MRTETESAPNVAGSVSEMDPARQLLMELLVFAREGKGWSRSTAASLLGVRESLLASLEAGRFAEIGPIVYVKGYLERYAELLGIGSHEINAAVESWEATRPKTFRPVRPMAFRKRSIKIRLARFGIAACGLFALGYGMLWLVSYWGGDSSEVFVAQPVPPIHSVRRILPETVATESPPVASVARLSSTLPAPTSSPVLEKNAADLRHASMPSFASLDTKIQLATNPIPTAELPPLIVPETYPTPQSAQEKMRDTSLELATESTLAAELNHVLDANSGPSESQMDESMEELATSEDQPLLRSEEDTLELVLQTNCWVDIQDATGKRLVYKLLSAKTYSVQGKAPFSITFGNRHAVTSLELNGTPINLSKYQRQKRSVVARFVLHAENANSTHSTAQ